MLKTPLRPHKSVRSLTEELALEKNALGVPDGQSRQRRGSQYQSYDQAQHLNGPNPLRVTVSRRAVVAR